MDQSKPIKIDPNAFYFDDGLVELLNLTHGALSAARRSGALKFIRKGRCNLYRGEAVLNWLDTSVVSKGAEDGE